MKRKRKLSAARTRTELITENTAAALAAATTPPAASEGGDPAPAPTGDTVACPTCEEKNDPKAKFCDQCGAKMVLAEEGAEAAASNGTPPPPAKNAPPVASPSNGDGTKIDAGVTCGNGDCAHLAEQHANIDGGENNGPCTDPNCDCPGMAVSADPGTPKPGDVTAAGGIMPPGDPAMETTDGSEQNPAPEVAGGDSMGPAFTIPVAIIEGQPTGDGRQITTGALSWRVPPVPLMGLATETHDPNGFDMNDPAVLCGRIDGFERVPGENGTQLIKAWGFYLPNEDGMYFAELNEAMGRMGVSADVAVQASEVIVGEIDSDGWPTEMSENLTEGTIMGVTVCPYPAFAGAYIVLGDGSDIPDAQAIPQQTEDPENIVAPDAPPAAVVAGGQLLRFVTYDECAPCDQGIEVIVASGAGPTRPPKAWFSDPGFTPEDGRLVEILDRRGERVLGGKYACPITVTADGRVFGHLAPWGVCHTGSSNQCIVAPHSSVDYAHFKRGQHITTAEGEKIRVGVLTADTGHAPTSGISAAAAMAHYDNTAFAAADVAVGEDEFGIWVAGAIRPDATEEQIRNLTASSLSGDWRMLGGQLELVAALAVNQPGFPLAVVAHGHVESLVAAGGSTMYAIKNNPTPDVEPGDVVLRAALQPMLAQAGQLARGRIDVLRAG